MVIELGNTLLSEEIIKKEFVCNLKACKGQCCVQGDAGAPLEESELEELELNYDKIKPYLNDSGRESIAKQGLFTDDVDGEKVTTLVENKECAYAVFDDSGVASCGIEKSWLDGQSSFRKPISCHLYPIRLRKLNDYTALNYDRWPICSDACKLGKELKVPIYKFAKDALIRKFGESYYLELENMAESYASKINHTKK